MFSMPSRLDAGVFAKQIPVGLLLTGSCLKASPSLSQKPTSVAPLECPNTNTVLSAGASAVRRLSTSCCSPRLMRSTTGVCQPLHTLPDDGSDVGGTLLASSSRQKPVSNKGHVQAAHSAKGAAASRSINDCHNAAMPLLSGFGILNGIGCSNMACLKGHATHQGCSTTDFSEWRLLLPYTHTSTHSPVSTNSQRCSTAA